MGEILRPAIALAAFKAIEVDADAVLLIMPADHVINDNPKFADAVLKGKKAALDGKLATFGVVPDSPHTGYGYIQSGQSQGDWAVVDSFVEKPDEATAKNYISSGNYYWNSGMFMFRADRYLEELGKFNPKMIAICERAFDQRTTDLDFIRVDAGAFESSPSDSIDYAVMEKTDAAVVVPLDAGWSDVGSWSALWEIHQQDEQGNVCKGDVITEDVSNSYIHSDSRLVAAIGVDNYVIVETNDVILVADKSRVQDVKKLVAQVKQPKPA